MVQSELMWRKDLLKRIFILAWPAMLEQTLQTVVQYADSAMVGQMGAAASAAVGLSSPVNWLVNAPMFAMGVGFLACISRSLGAKDEETARTAAMQSIFAAVVMGLGLMILTLAVSPFLPGWLHADAEIYDTAAHYFFIVSLPMLFRSATIIFSSCLRAAGDTRTPMRVSLLMNLTNICFNALLIFPTGTVRLGNLVLPGAGLGVEGAAIATALSYLVSGTLMFLALMRSPALSLKGRKLKLNKPVMGQCVRIGMPAVFTRISVCLGHVVFLSQVSGLGTIPLAAHSLALTAEEAVYLPGFGMQAAASTLAGNAAGEGDEAFLRGVTRACTAVAVMIMTVLGGLMFLFAEPLLGIFTPDQQVIAAGASVLRIVAVVEPIYAVSIILEGVFNGVGDTRAPFYFNLFTMWGIRILSTALCLNVFHLGLNAVWCCMGADNVTRAILFVIRYGKGKWKKAFHQPA